MKKPPLDGLIEKAKRHYRLFSPFTHHYARVFKEILQKYFII
jgi:hypothetical protein